MSQSNLPYLVEIFDRSFGYIYHCLIDEGDFTYNFDAIDPEKNTLKVPTDFKPSELRSDYAAPRGWYIRIKRDTEEYQGIISGFEAGDTYNKVTYSQMITIFDLDVLVSTQGISQTTIEEYIALQIQNAFGDSSDNDPSQELLGLVVTTSSSTTGTLSYTDSDDDEVTINLLDDLIYPAMESYSIVPTVKFDPQKEIITANFGVNSSDKRYIEADLPNVVDSTFTIRKTSKEINKVSVIDIENDDTEYTYYLYTDGTIGTDREPTDHMRIIPVKNQITSIKGTTLSEQVVDAKYQLYANVIEAYAYADRTLTTEELATLKNALSALWSMITSSISVKSCSFTVNDYEDAGYTVTKATPTYNGISYSISADPIRNITTSIQATPTSSTTVEWTAKETTDSKCHIVINFNYTCSFTAEASGSGAIYVFPTSSSANVNICEYITDSIVSSAISAYKSTEAYQKEVEEAFETTVKSNAIAKATSVFNKNTYNDLIEITCLNNDSMLDPLNIEIGQLYEIIHQGISYTSILTGKEIEDGECKLIFGTLRLELTKYLKGRS